jgi:hypothetical protein
MSGTNIPVKFKGHFYKCIYSKLTFYIYKFEVLHTNQKISITHHTSLPLYIPIECECTDAKKAEYPDSYRLSYMRAIPQNVYGMEEWGIILSPLPGLGKVTIRNIVQEFSPKQLSDIFPKSLDQLIGISGLNRTRVDNMKGIVDAIWDSKKLLEASDQNIEDINDYLCLKGVKPETVAKIMTYHKKFIDKNKPKDDKITNMFENKENTLGKKEKEKEKDVGDDAKQSDSRGEKFSGEVNFQLTNSLNTLTLLKEHPYQFCLLLYNTTFVEIDDMCMKCLGYDTKPFDFERIYYGIHCIYKKKKVLYLKMADFREELKKTIGLVPEEIIVFPNTESTGNRFPRWREIIEIYPSVPLSENTNPNIPIEYDVIQRKHADQEAYIAGWIKTAVNTKYSQDIDFDADNLPNGTETESKFWDFPLSNEQQSAVQMAIKSRFSTISGSPGTGKTSIIKYIIKYISHNTHMHNVIFNSNCGNRSYSCNCMPKYFILAPTGCATYKIQTTLTKGDEARVMTIHRFLAYLEKLTLNKELQAQEGFCMTGEVANCVNLIIDESSMITMGLMHLLLTMMSKSKIHVVRIVLVGDKNQLPCIGLGQIFTDIINMDSVTKSDSVKPQNKMLQKFNIELTKVYRQNGESLIVKNSKRILHKEALTFRKDMDMLKSTIDENYVDKLVNYFKRGSMIITPVNISKYGVSFLNSELQRKINKNFNLFSNPAYQFKNGDPIIQNTNNYDINLFNGTNGEILDGWIELDGKRYEKSEQEAQREMASRTTKSGNAVTDGLVYCLQIKLIDERVIIHKQIEELDLRYVQTVHKSQGQQFKKVCFILMKEFRFMNTQQLVYTAISRAEEKCVVMTDYSPSQMVFFPAKREITHLTDRLLESCVKK